MIKKTIKYTDFNDQERQEDFYFHISKADIIELEAKHKGGLRWYLERIQQEQDIEKIYGFLTEIVRMSYGRRSDDGTKFIKNSQLWEEFRSSEAFSELMIGFLQDVEDLNRFINGIVPRDMANQLAKLQAAPGPRPAASEADWNVFEGAKQEEPFVPTESLAEPPREALSDKPAAVTLTEAQIREMDPVELQRGLVEGRFKLAS